VSVRSIKAGFGDINWADDCEDGDRGDGRTSICAWKFEASSLENPGIHLAGHQRTWGEMEL